MNPTPRRRAGLSADGYKGPSLLKIINRPTTLKRGYNEMPPKSFARSVPAKKLLTTQEPYGSTKEKKRISHSQDKSSSSSDEDAAADILPTTFGKRPESAKADTESSKAGTRGLKTQKPTPNVNSRGNALTQKAMVLPSSNSGSSSIKRKSNGSQEDRFLGRKFPDPFGRPPKRTKPKAMVTYGSGLPRLTSSQSSQNTSSPLKSSPQALKRFEIPGELDSPIKSQDSKFWRPDDIEESPQKPNTPPRNGFIKYDKLEDSLGPTPEVEKVFKVPSEVGSPSFSENKTGESFMDSRKFDYSPAPTPPATKKLFERSTYAAPVRRDPPKLLDHKNHNLGGDLAARVQNIIGLDDGGLNADSTDLFDDDFDGSMITKAHCPMCNKPCDAVELKKWGTMNTRQQERFCRSHRKATAQRKWASKGYPEIDWENLDSRISEHREFIESLLNGADCHFRTEFEKMVAAGKARNLRKMESNLTPGYYGSRGLNTISEHVIREFSVLLSTRSIKDTLMSKRGTTSFVQSVIVPEVAVQLIMKDMSIEDAEARDVLVESASIGELVHEEIRDVVVQTVVESEDED